MATSASSKIQSLFTGGHRIHPKSMHAGLVESAVVTTNARKKEMTQCDVTHTELELRVQVSL